MKKLKLILAVAFVVILCCALLIGCTPSKPSDYMKKWSDSEHKSVTSAVTTDGVKEEVSEGKYEDWQYGGRTTIETTFIKSGDMLMQKTIVITNKKDKNGKDAKTDDIKPTFARIYQINKEGKYNVYTYSLVWEKESATSEEIVQKGQWTAYQDTKENVENSIEYKFVNAVFEEGKEDIEKFITTFDDKYTKEKGAYVSQADKDGHKIYLKTKSGELISEEKDSEGKVVLTKRYDLNEKITISSGANEALNKFLQTKDGKITKIEDKKDEKIYYITVEDKEYKVNSKVTGYEKLADSKVDDIVSVRVKPGFLGMGTSISDIFELK